jgi:hypothetical protein
MPNIVPANPDWLLYLRKEPDEWIVDPVVAWNVEWHIDTELQCYSYTVLPITLNRQRLTRDWAIKRPDGKFADSDGEVIAESLDELTAYFKPPIPTQP